MARILVRNLPDAVVERLKLQAARNGRSLEAEVRQILEGAVRVDREGFARRAAAMRERLAGRHHTPAVDLLREIRGR